MISKAVREKQHGPPLVLSLLSLSLSLPLTDFRPHSLSSVPFLSSPHAPSSLFSPCLSFWANLKPRRQRPLSVPSVWSQCQPQCPSSLHLPATHTPPSTHRSTMRRVSLSPIHGAIYTPALFIQPIRAGWAPWCFIGVFVMGMAPAERPSCRPPVEDQLHRSCSSDMQEPFKNSGSGLQYSLFSLIYLRYYKLITSGGRFTRLCLCRK